MKWMFVEGEGKHRTCICFWFQTIYKSPHMHWTGMLRENSNHDFLSGALFFSAAFDIFHVNESGKINSGKLF